MLMGGCGLYGTYSRPDLDVNVDSLYRASLAPTDSAGLSALPWRRLFTDSCLQSLIAAGLERNVDLEVARLQVTEAQAVLANARLSYLPSAALTPQASVSRFDSETKKTYSVGGTVSWDVDLPGRTTNAKRAAAASLDQSVTNVQLAQCQLVATIAESYYTLLMLDEQLAISIRTAANWDQTIAALQVLAQAGRTNEVAVRRAQARRTALDASVLNIRQSIGETENALSALLKEPPHAIVRSALADQRFADEVSVGVPLALLSGRPDVRMAEAALAQAFYAVNSARAAFYPTLTLSGTLGWTNSGGGAIVNPAQWLTSAMTSLTAPLFTRGTNCANLRIAEARQREATLRFEQSLLDVGNEVNDALAQWQTADARIRLDSLQIADLDAATEQTRLLVRYSSVNYLEVLTAEQSLLTARLTLAQDRIAKISAVVRLYCALGGGAE